ncbi:HYR domain-containing protein [Cystobacter fuscus]
MSYSWEDEPLVPPRGGHLPPGGLPSTGNPSPQPAPTTPGETPALGGFVVVTGDDADDLWHCEGALCGGLFPSLFREAISRSRTGGQGILAIGVNGEQALTAFDSWNAPAQGGPGAAVTHVRSTEDISRVDFTRYAFVYLPSAQQHTLGGLTAGQIGALNERQPDPARFVNERGGSLIALTQAGVTGGWGFLPAAHHPGHRVRLRRADPGADRLRALADERGAQPQVLPQRLHRAERLLGPARARRQRRGLPPGQGPAGDARGLGHRPHRRGLRGWARQRWGWRGGWRGPGLPVCGNGRVDPGEACDDGNTVDGDGCSNSCVSENRAPEVTCRDATVCTDPGLCVATSPTGTATATDPDGDEISWDTHPLGPYAPGTHGLCVTASDGRKIDSCWSNVTVRDCEAPRFTCPADFTVECSAEGSAPVTPPEVGATDNCAVAQVTRPEGGELPLGTHELVYTATDAAGNTATCAPKVTVVDSRPPSVSCPAPITAECTGRNSAWVSPGAAHATDSCTEAALSGPEADFYPLGVNTVRYTARDSSGNEARAPPPSRWWIRRRPRWT